MDRMEIEILEDGTIKATTDKISAQNHSTAEAFMRNLATAGGGAKQERKHRSGLLGAAVHAVQHLLSHGHDH